MKSFIFAMIAVVASSFASVQAGYLAAGSASFNNSTSDLVSPANTNSSFVFDTNNATSGTGSFSGDVGTYFGSFTLPAHSGSGYPLSITGGPFGSFSGNVFVDSYVGDDANNVRSFLASGTFTRTGFDPTPSSISFSVTETGASYSYAFTISVTPPPAAVPEPASMAIFGLGALGLAARRYRRK
jgi:hypothetical protein